MQEYNVCYSLDSNYVEQISVSIVSILKNSNKDEKFNFYILDGGLSSEDKKNIEQLKDIKDFKLNYVKVNLDDFKNCPLLKDTNNEYSFYHVTLPTYFRFKLSTLLPNIDKILYLDCDVLVRSSLKELFEVDIKNNAVAMVKDVESKKESKRLNLKNYYNAGVMLINLDYWRKNNVEQKLFEYANQNKKTILWQDQDIISCVLQNKIKSLETKWNYSYFLYNEIDKNELKDSVIIHLAGRFKPWVNPIEHPLYDLYYDYLAYTSFKNKILTYKNSINGQYLKNNIAGSETNILVKTSDVDLNEKTKETYDYVNKLVEDTSIHTAIATDEKIQKLVSEIKETYDYVDKLVEDTSIHTTITTDEKIQKLVSEIKETYDYVDKLVEDTSIHTAIATDEKIQKLVSEIKETYDYVDKLVEDTSIHSTIATDKQIKKLLSEIREVYEYVNKLVEDTSIHTVIATDEKIQKLVSELKEVCNYVDSALKEVSYKERTQTDKQVTEIYEEITKNYDYTKDEILKNYDKQRIETDEKISAVYDEISKNYAYTNEEIQKSVNQIKSEIENSVLSTNISDYEEKLNDKIKEQTFDFYSEIEKICRESDVVHRETKKSLKNDIQELKQYIEEDIVSKVSSETDCKINTVYEEITRNYEFTKEIVKETNDVFQEKNSILEKIINSEKEKLNVKIKEISNVVEQNDGFINSVNDCLLKKIEYTEKGINKKLEGLNETINDIKFENIAIKESLKEKIKEEFCLVREEIDNSSEKVDEEIDKIKAEFVVQSKKIESTFKKAEQNRIELYTYIDNQNEKQKTETENKFDLIQELFGEKIKEIELKEEKERNLKLLEFSTASNNEISKLYSDVENNVNTLNERINNTQNEIYSKYYENKYHIDTIKQEYVSKSLYENEKNIVELKIQQVEEENSKKITSVIENCEKQLNEQRKKYEKKLIKMEEKIEDLEKQYKNKSLFNKIFDKYIKR